MQGIVNLCNTALVASTAALKNISNNLANMNTAGYRATRTSFGDLFDAGTKSGGGTVNGGVSANTSMLNMTAGSYNTTGGNLDLAVLGAGFFVLKDNAGNISYTRDGRFSMNGDKLVANNGSVVQAYGDGGSLIDLSVEGSQLSNGKATSAVTFDSNLPNILNSGLSKPLNQDISVFDGAGGKHTLTLVFTPIPAIPGQPSSIQFAVSVQEAGQSIGSPKVPFSLVFGSNGKPVAGGATFTFTYTPTGLAPVDVSVDCSAVQSLSSGTSALTPKTDGNAPGSLQRANLTFDAAGVMQLSYDNGTKQKGQTIALAMTDDVNDWKQSGAGAFEPLSPSLVRVGTAGGLFGNISPHQIEGSNVDMSSEFSDMILSQRMYQSASQVIQATNTLSDALLRAAGGR